MGSPERILLAAAGKEEGMSLKVRLEAFGYTVKLVRSGASAVQTFNRAVYSFCIICEAPPAVEGISALKGLRALSDRVPILVIGPFQQEYARITRYEAGADGLLNRDFNFRELLLRMAVLRKRSQIPWPTDQRVFEIGHMEFNVDTALLTDKRGSILLRCAPRERDLLRVLCGYRNQLVCSDALLYYLWGKSSRNFSRCMYDMLTRIKKRLGREHALRTRRIGGTWLQLLTADDRTESSYGPSNTEK